MQKIYMEKTKNFNTIITEAYFPFSFEKEDILKKTILPSLILYTNEKNPTEESFRKEISRHGIFSLRASFTEIGKQHFLVFTLIIPDKKTIGEDLYKEAISFFFDTIYHPNLINGTFEEELFQKEKRRLEKDIESVFHNIDSYSNYKIWNALDPKEEYLISSINHKEKLNRLTSKDVYDFYKKIVSKKKPILFIYGDFIKKDVKENIENYLKKEKATFIKDFHPIYKDFFSKKIEKIIHIEEKKDFHQSRLTYVYQVENVKEEDEAILKCIDAILSSSSTNLLMEKMRNELGLVYSTYSKRAGNNSLLFLTANLYKENRKKTEKGFCEVMEILKDEEKVGPLLEEIKEDIKVAIIEKEDSKYALMNSYIKKTLKAGKTLEDIYKEILALTKEDIVNFQKRLKKILIFFLEGEANE